MVQWKLFGGRGHQVVWLKSRGTGEGKNKKRKRGSAGQAGDVEGQARLISEGLERKGNGVMPQLCTGMYEL